MMLISLAVLLASTVGQDPVAVTFPGPLRELRSPDSAFTIAWWGPDAGSPHYRLLLGGAHTPKTWEIYTFTRTVTVSWAPRDSLLAVTDLSDPDDVTTFVHDARRSRSTEVCAPAQRELGDRWTRSRQRYCEQVGWSRDGELLLRLHGDGNGTPFDVQAAIPFSRE